MGHGAFYDAPTRTFYVFGGADTDEANFNNKLYSYSLDTQQWKWITDATGTLPPPNGFFGSVRLFPPTIESYDS